MTNPAVPDTSSTGLAPATAAALAYVAWWVSGLLFFLIERESRFVRFHAAQAMVALGALWAAGLALWALAFAAIFISATLFSALLYASYVVWFAGIVVWALCIVRAWKGEEWELPIAGGFARRLSSF